MFISFLIYTGFPDKSEFEKAKKIPVVIPKVEVHSNRNAVKKVLWICFLYVTLLMFVKKVYFRVYRKKHELLCLAFECTAPHPELLES